MLGAKSRAMFMEGSEARITVGKPADTKGWQRTTQPISRHWRGNCNLRL